MTLFILLGLLWGSGALAADKLRELQDRFDRETHAGRKIKQLQKLGAAQFEAATAAGNAGDFSAVGLIFEKYRDNVRSASELLRKQVPDADKHSGGYRQLELVVRQGIHEVEDTILTVPEPMRPPLQIVDKDLLEIDGALIRLLFPLPSNRVLKKSRGTAILGCARWITATKSMEAVVPVQRQTAPIGFFQQPAKEPAKAAPAPEATP